MHSRSPNRCWRAGLLLQITVWMIGVSMAAAQDAPRPSPPVPPPAPMPVAGSPDERLRRLEERLDQVSKQNAAMQEQLGKVTEQNERLSQENRKLAETFGGSSGAATGLTPWEGRAGSSTGGDLSAPLGPTESGGGDPTTTGRAQIIGNRKLGRIGLKGFYDYLDDGFRFATDDDEITFGVRAMATVEARIYQQRNQDPVSSGIYVPRTRFYFEGQFSKPLQYEFSFQESFTAVNLLDVYLQYNFDPRFKLRFGRYKSPFSYEWYRVHVWELLAPERSLFAQNFEGNRRFGLMGLGDLFDKRVEYAVGSFDGGRNSYVETANSQDVMAFLNFKPFDPIEGHPLRDFQVGGSVDAGHENNPLSPAVITTNVPPSGTTLSQINPGLPILAFHDDVRERGARALWELHAAYYYQGLSILAAWQGGVESYAKGISGTKPVGVPIGGYFAQVGYIVTGETIRDRTLIDPLHPFDLRPGKFGLGAFEVTARYSELSLGRNVFTGGLADPNQWSNQAGMTDVGFNWYLNKFVKMYFDWEHVVFGQPATFRPGGLQKTSDLFWLRTQVYF
jgi:phosphate-selective porin OprO and OprP